MPKRYGSLDFSTGIYVIGQDKDAVEQRTHSTASPLSDLSYRRKDDFLPLFTDIVDLDAPDLLDQLNGNPAGKRRD